MKSTSFLSSKLKTLLFLALFITVAGASTLSTPSSITVVDVRGEVRPGVVLAVQGAAGLLNRVNASVYVIQGSDDVEWLALLLPTVTKTTLVADDFLRSALARFGAILYFDPTSPTQTQLLPSVLTLAGVLDLIPLSEQLFFQQYPSTRIGFNASRRWTSPEQAVNESATIGLSRTSSLAFQDGKLVATGLLVDWIVKERIFTQYLNRSCIPATRDHALLQALLAAAPWPRPVRVYGYNSADVIFGGDLFEAETNCANVMGQVATAHSTNLAFWSHVAPITTPLTQPSAPAIEYNRSKAYVALVYGDMDNIDFVESFGRDHMQERARRCAPPAAPCFPLTWTLSPNLLKFAPAIMRWYYNVSSTTGGRDWFIMPPSGTLYSYPGQMPSAVQGQYVEQQNAQATLMNSSGSVHWEWILTWQNAWDHYFPRYQSVPAGHGTRAFFLNNVPWVFPIPDMYFKGETYRIVGSGPDAVVAFRPAFNWQEDGPSGGLPYNSTVIAGRINNFALGSVQYIYVIQNTNMSSVFDMTTRLAPHVELVSYQQLTSLALQRGG
eukprot:m.233717 g.233717  ORF g.233717 m.233717 type:complete len:552 (-) comp19281_c0_seq1:156-1811(-)